MNEERLLGEHSESLALALEPREETLLQSLQRAENIAQAQQAFLRMQEAKVRAAEQQDAADAKSLSLHVAIQGY